MDVALFCKCHKETAWFCLIHGVPVCGDCICSLRHQLCVAGIYMDFYGRRQYELLKCCQCQATLETGTEVETIRLGCLHVMHTNCLVSLIENFPSHTAPEDYVCPLCSTSIWPPRSEEKGLEPQDSGSYLCLELKTVIKQFSRFDIKPYCPQVTDIDLVCKCLKATVWFCLTHGVPLCGDCICSRKHQLCAVGTYMDYFFGRGRHELLKCCQCQAAIEMGTEIKTTRLGCLHVMHTDCLVSLIENFPPHTAPEDYVCPSCSTVIWPPKSEEGLGPQDSGSRLCFYLKEVIKKIGIEKKLLENLPISLPGTESHSPPPAFASDTENNDRSNAVEEISSDCEPVLDVAIVCKCHKATMWLCINHGIPVCAYCICAVEHQFCVVETYMDFYGRGLFELLKCCQCQATIERGTEAEITRLGCLHVMHTDCLVSLIESFPPHTAPKNYVCPSCFTLIWPPKSEEKGLEPQDSVSLLCCRLKAVIKQFSRFDIELYCEPVMDVARVCKCCKPTEWFCLSHGIPVCRYCICSRKHRLCVVGTYMDYFCGRGRYELLKCCQCQATLERWTQVKTT